MSQWRFQCFTTLFWVVSAERLEKPRLKLKICSLTRGLCKGMCTLVGHEEQIRDWSVITLLPSVD